MRNPPYKQYVYHFNYPTNSIDVRTITDIELKWCIMLYIHRFDLTRDIANTKTAITLLSDHFPEYVI